MKKFEANTFTQVVLWFIVVAQVMKIFSTWSSLSLNSMFGADPTYGITVISFSAVILLLAVLSATLKNPVPIAALLSVITLRTFLQIPFGTNIAYAYLLGGNVVELIKDGIPLCIGLTLKPGWKAYCKSFKKKQYTEEEIIEDFKNAWITLDPNLMIKHLDKTFRYDSQWVMESLDMEGYKKYITGKFETLRNKDSKLEVEIVTDSTYGGKMLHIIQNGNHVCYRIRIEQGKVIKGDLCIF